MAQQPHLVNKQLTLARMTEAYLLHLKPRIEDEVAAKIAEYKLSETKFSKFGDSRKSSFAV